MAEKKIKNIIKDFQDSAPSIRDLYINENPIQLPGQDKILRTYTLGGPNCGRDIRFIIDVETLEYMIDIARKSQTRRAVIPSAGIKLMVRQATTGHVYETLHLEGGIPIPEQPPEKFSVQVPRADYLRGSIIRDWKG